MCVILLVNIVFTSYLAPFVDYFVNRDYIVNNLCENRDKPEQKCNGKCHLMKEIGKSAEDDSKQNRKVKEKRTEDICSPAQFLFRQILTVDIVRFFTEINLYKFSYLSAIYHPPIS